MLVALWDFRGLPRGRTMGIVFHFLLAPHGGWRGLLPADPLTFSFPFGGSGWGGWGGGGANARVNPPPLLSHLYNPTHKTTFQT